ncbi:MAG: transcription termination/antitermination protein NusA, partial [Treponema sp.]|nr:transcription termination/antitermination protein NusA [Treponema sp.]
SESRKAVSELFGDSEEISRSAELPGITPETADAFLAKEIDFIQDFLELSGEELAKLEGVTESQIAELRKLIEEYVEIVEDEETAEMPETETETEKTGGEVPGVPDEAENEEYECPECGAKITVDMTNCPNCGIGLSFEYEEE